MKKLTTRSMTLMALLIAVMVVTERFFAVDTQFLRVSATFIPATLMGAVFGPLWSGIGSTLADFVGMALFPKAAYFVGFSINAFVTGAVYGYFYYKKEITWRRVIMATVLVTVIVHLILTPIWLAWMYNVPLNSWAIWTPRLIKNALMLPIQIVVTYFMGNLTTFKQLVLRGAASTK
ncbi:membrane protein [Enterococcus canis]|uniref:Membrane protein n=1 Tax=Enterococcus canis TaxID=214095 RepID=A0A1L8RFQ3_9ENTE|nr:folate family ECF transporter S component [Enterococcus canis]OJG18600.1 membrane protein [Enterococcus canis]